MTSTCSDLPWPTCVNISLPHCCRHFPRFFPAAARFVPLPEEADRDLGRPMLTHRCALRRTAVYICCLLSATASLTLSTECHCFSTATTAARQVCAKHLLIKSLLSESLMLLLVNRCPATTALLQLLCGTAIPGLSLPTLRISASNAGQQAPLCRRASGSAFFLRIFRWCVGSSSEEPDR